MIANFYGTPDEIFREDVINRLYDLPDGAYNIAFGSVELPRVGGAPQAFVLSAGGTGIPVYRALQRAGVPFAAVTQMKEKRTFALGEIKGIDDLKNELTLRVEEDFGLNSMHVVRIDGSFARHAFK